MSSLWGIRDSKGAWLSFWLSEMGARVSETALPPETTPNLHGILDVARLGNFIHADINDRAALQSLFAGKAGNRFPSGRAGAGPPILRRADRHICFQRNWNGVLVGCGPPKHRNEGGAGSHK